MPPPSPQVETGRRTRHRRSPPRLPRSFFLHDLALPRHRLPVAPSKEAVWHLSCGASPAPAGFSFANYLDVPPSLLSRRLVVALLPLSLHRCLSLRHLSHCAAVSLSHRRRKIVVLFSNTRPPNDLFFIFLVRHCQNSSKF
jgi:hypothetical protein